MSSFTKDLKWPAGHYKILKGRRFLLSNGFFRETPGKQRKCEISMIKVRRKGRMD